MAQTGDSCQAKADLPRTVVRSVQTDGASCGLHICMRMEELVREWRGEGRVACYLTTKEVAKQVNQWVQVLNMYKAKQPGSAAPPVPTVPPPLPPPSQSEEQETQVADQAAAAMMPLAAIDWE